MISLKTLDDLSEKSEKAYEEVLERIEKEQEKRFQTKDLGPWAWSDPFCREDPLDKYGVVEIQNLSTFSFISFPCKRIFL